MPTNPTHTKAAGTAAGNSKGRKDAADDRKAAVAAMEAMRWQDIEWLELAVAVMVAVQDHLSHCSSRQPRWATAGRGMWQ
jgi:hypothetical protein